MADKQQIVIPDHITVGALAELLSLPASKLIAELLKNGVMATINEKIDFDTAQIIVEDLGLDFELAKKEISLPPPRPSSETGPNAQPRPPVAAFMGHVDHGKTSLLDAIREANTAKTEAGGITQHLSAYQIEYNGRLVTMLDTPGHEAFAALRQHGAHLTDVAVIVVAADEGIMPQTIEAIRFAKKAGVKIVVAANKIDKPTADINRLKQQLTDNGLAPEGWGGDTVVIPVSATTKEGVSELVDMIILLADVEELKADPTVPAQGMVIESHMEKGRGPVAMVLVEQGTLRPGDFLVVGDTYGKIRTLESSDGQTVSLAGPSMPAIITGLKALPEFGETFQVTDSEKEARQAAADAARQARVDGISTAVTGGELLRQISRSTELTEFNVVVKADVQGSLTSVIDSIKALDSEQVAVKIVGSGVGLISESDVRMAAAAGAVIYGFNTELPVSIKQLAVRDHVPVRIYKVIYELIDDVKKELQARLPEEIIEESIAKLIVKGVFKTTKTETIAGGEVTVGKISMPASARLRRDKQVLADGLELTGLKSGPTEVSEVSEGSMCGFSLSHQTRLDIKEGDRVEFYTRTTKPKEL